MIFSRLSSITKPLSKTFGSAGNNMVIRQSYRSGFHLYDEMLYYVALASIPCFAITFFFNVRYGKAKLVDTPQDYSPEPYEYEAHPVSRFFAKYIYPTNPDAIYEHNVNYYKQKTEEERTNKLLKWFKRSIVENKDFKGWYHLPADNSAVIGAREDAKDTNLMGQRFFK